MVRLTQEALRALPSFSELTKWNISLLQKPAKMSLPYDLSNFLNLRCETTTIPTRSAANIEVNMRGHKVYQNGLVTFNGDMTLTFLETDDTFIREFIDAWFKLAQDPLTGKQTPKKDLEARFRLEMLDKEDNPIYAYTIIGAIPSTEDKGSLDGSSSDVMKPSLTINYDRAIPEKIKG